MDKAARAIRIDIIIAAAAIRFDDLDTQNITTTKCQLVDIIEDL